MVRGSPEGTNNETRTELQSDSREDIMVGEENQAGVQLLENCGENEDNETITVLNRMAEEEEEEERETSLFYNATILYKMRKKKEFTRIKLKKK